MDRRRANDVVFRTKQLDGPRHGVVVWDALVTPRPIELVDILAEASVLVDPEYAPKACKRRLVVEMKSAAAGDGVGLTIAHVPADSRHALLDLGRIVGANVDVCDNGGCIAGRLGVEANSEIGPGHDAVE